MAAKALRLAPLEGRHAMTVASESARLTASLSGKLGSSSDHTGSVQVQVRKIVKYLAVPVGL